MHVTRQLDLSKPVLGGQGTAPEPLDGGVQPEATALPGKRFEHESVVVNSSPYFDQRVLAGLSSRASAETGEQQQEHHAERAVIDSDFISSILHEQHPNSQAIVVEGATRETQQAPSPHSKHWHSTAMSLSEVADVQLIQMMREKLKQLRTQKEACRRRTSIVEKAIEALDPANHGQMPEFEAKRAKKIEEKKETSLAGEQETSLQGSTDRQSLKGRSKNE